MTIQTKLTCDDTVRELSTQEQQLGKTILTQNLGYTSGDSVLIVTDTQMLEQEAAIWFETAKRLNGVGDIRLLVLEGMTHSGQEPPVEVITACAESDIILLHTRFSLTHTRAGKAIVKHGKRGASLPTVNLDMMLRTLTTDYQPIKQLGETIKAHLEAGQKLTITAANGTNLIADIRTDSIYNDSGILNPGEIGNLPAGEVFFAPLLGSAEGSWVIDGSLADEPDLNSDQPVVLTIAAGTATEINGGQAAQRLKRKLNQLDPSALTVAELGIGTNRQANPRAEIIEAEKAFGTAHLALGNSSAIGGEVDVPIHLDGVTLNPTIKIDERVILEQGQFTI